IDNQKQDQPAITKIRFQVEDTGIGIPPDQLEKIFLPFEQVGDKSRHSEGTGLGLAITQKILEMMGSQIFVESTPQVGSTFWFDVDLPSVSTQKNLTPVKSITTIINYSGEKRKILVVDDRWENCAVIINMLEPIGFELVEAANGQEGLEKAIEFQPDLILVDLVMPVMDGYQMTRQLRQFPELQNTIVIAISANAFEADCQKSLDAGCNDFLPKPIQAEELLKKIKNYLNLSWIYDNPEELESSQNPPSSSREIVIPPRNELLALHQAVLTGDVEGVEYESIRLQDVSPDYIPFVIRVLELAQDFEYEEIAKFIEPYLL
ncbi:MAG TPA: response regulator, partial [Cyanophyceae cyanobacterium]